MTTPLPLAKIEQIKVAYLASGCFAEAARQTETSPRTVRKYIQEWIADNPSEFEFAQRTLRTLYRAESEKQIQDCMHIARERVAGSHEGKGPDPRPQYMSAMVQWHKGLVNGARVDAEIAGDIAGPGAVQIQVLGPEDMVAELDDGSQETEPPPASETQDG